MTTPSGIEGTRPATLTGGDEQPCLDLPQHVRLTQVILHDRTDNHNELVHEPTWLLHPAEPLALRGNLFVLEDLAGHGGWMVLKEAPLPDVRASVCEVDLRVAARKAGGFRASWDTRDGYDVHVIPWTGGPFERTQALQDFQRRRLRRPIARMISNTWGDRNRDSRICESFILQEIQAAADLGVDVVQIDDGWQRGTTSNSAQASARGGVWSGFYAADDNFWSPHPLRFPNGLEPVLQAARNRGLGVGLWFAPDSSEQFANWQRDVQTVLSLHRTHGVDHFKFDGIDCTSAAAEGRLKRMFADILDQSQGKVIVDLDVTAGRRPGYYGMMATGPVFVENRYTDWHRYWPHQSLRVLWQLSRWVDPLRLRMEFLNPTRHGELYEGDPLAPGTYDPAAIFATTMFAQPLAWFEVSNLPASCQQRITPLVGIWKQVRQHIFSGTIVPIGNAPDGWSWSGFASIALERDAAVVLLFRGRNDQPTAELDLPVSLGDKIPCQVLAGDGAATCHGDRITARIEKPQGFLLVQIADPALGG